MILGIDEAGRGPVIGPLVLCAVCADDKTIERLEELQVKDSKKILPKKREILAEEIKKMVTFEYEIIDAKQINKFMLSGTNLNQIEEQATIRLIDKFQAKTIILDCPSANRQAYKKTIQQHTQATVIAEYKADDTYPIVSAASILAKVMRDSLTEKIKQEIGIDFGSGYPSDKKTQAFVKEHWQKYEIFRTQWSSYQRVKTMQEQQALNRF